MTHSAVNLAQCSAWEGDQKENLSKVNIIMAIKDVQCCKLILCTPR